MLFPASFKLVLMCCSCLHHLLPWVASCSLFMHHARVCIMPCSCVVCLLCCVLLLDSSCFIAIVRIRSSTLGSSSWLHLLHGLVLLPCGISGKMTIPSKSRLSLLASCSLFCYAAIPTTWYIMPPILPWQASNPPFLANRCLAMLPLCSAPLIALLVAGEDWSLFLVGACLLLGYNHIILFILMHLYTW